MDKSDLRKEIRELFREIDRVQFSEWSRVIDDAICQRVYSINKESCTVLLYWSLDDEVPTHDIIERLQVLGHKVILPSVIGDNLHLMLYQGTDSLKLGAFGILEPSGATLENYDEIDIAFIPGRAFTYDGTRLGRGKGYYDRLLAQLHCPTVGVYFPFQLVDSINSEPHDIPCSELLDY